MEPEGGNCDPNSVENPPFPSPHLSPSAVRVMRTIKCDAPLSRRGVAVIPAHDPPVSPGLAQWTLHSLGRGLGKAQEAVGQFLFNLMVVLPDFPQALLICTEREAEISWVFKALLTQLLINKDDLLRASILWETKDLYLGIFWPGAQEREECGREELTCRAWN